MVSPLSPLSSPSPQPLYLRSHQAPASLALSGAAEDEDVDGSGGEKAKAGAAGSGGGGAPPHEDNKRPLLYMAGALEQLQISVSTIVSEADLKLLLLKIQL